ncbi:MAG: FtsX-like permease family protein, partial [Anderseniella sp.]|nr:FtsX-like permease family protein [Anderseniella sp.]
GEEPGYEGPQWLFLPVEEHLNIPGVQAASRVWDKEATARLRGNNVNVRMVGIDRIGFSKTAFFRHDFAPASLGALMNALAVRDDGILVSRDVLDYGLEVGSKIDVIVPLGEATQIDFTIVGVVDLFPRLYPEEGPFLVGNLDHIFNVAGGLYPYDVWLKTSSFVDTWTLGKEARELGLIVGHIQNARQNVDRMQLEPNRQGVFGLLSVGFIVSASVTVLGFLLYAYISFRQRYIEWGVLRAVGLSTGQMALSLVAEQLILILTGAGIGTGIGVFVSRLLIPFLQVEGGEHALTPPFIVQVAWTEITYIYTIFGAMFLAAVIALFFALRRMRIFEAIKLGGAA